MRRSLVLLLAVALLFGTLTGGWAGRTVLARVADGPPADPVQIVQAYYQQLAASVNSGDFTPLLAYFTPDAAIDSPLAVGGATGQDQILRFFASLPRMSGFTIEPSNLIADDRYVDADWRWRAAPGSLRGYLDGHDAFTISGGLISALTQDLDDQSAMEAFMPPARGRDPQDAPVATTDVSIANFTFSPRVISVPVGATVTWTNDDADPHAVTSVDKSIDVGVVEENVSITWTFGAAGTYQYYCTVHPGMRGTVIVGS